MNESGGVPETNWRLLAERLFGWSFVGTDWSTINFHFILFWLNASGNQCLEWLNIVPLPITSWNETRELFILKSFICVVFRFDKNESTTRQQYATLLYFGICQMVYLNRYSYVLGCDYNAEFPWRHLKLHLSKSNHKRSSRILATFYVLSKRISLLAFQFDNRNI